MWVTRNNLLGTENGLAPPVAALNAGEGMLFACLFGLLAVRYGLLAVGQR